MIRWAQQQDLQAVTECMKAAETGWPFYDYQNMDGLCLLDEEAGQIRGFVQFVLGKPDTQVRELGVLPQYRHGSVIGNLLASLIKIAMQYGSQGIEGFQLESNREWTEAIEKHGAMVQRGVRVRFPLTLIATRGARRWAERLT